MKAVRTLVEFAEDSNVDTTTRKWVFQALREITGQRLADDPAAWASWQRAR